MADIDTIFGTVSDSNETQWGLVEEYFEPLRNYYQDVNVTEIMVHRFDDISIERNGKLEKTTATFGSESALQTFIIQLARCLNQDIGEHLPYLDASLPDCSRLCCTLPEISPNGSTITLRVAPKKTLTIEQLVNFGALSQDMANFLISHIIKGSNFLISGNTGSGKTSIIRALSKFISDDEVVITCEDTLELFLHWLKFNVSLEAPNRKASNIEMKHLIERSLRMRPDRILVGEIRNAGAADAFLQAINTGHTGCMTTLHANSPVEAIERLQYLIASAGLISYELAHKQIVGAVNIIIQVKRHPTFGRKITEISVIKNKVVTPVFIFDENKGIHITTN